MQGKYYVIAGNAIQAKEFIKRKSLEMWNKGDTFISLSHFVYVADVTTLRGVSDPHGFFIGTWRERKDIIEILYQLLIATQDKERAKKFIDLKYEIARENNLRSMA